MLLGEKFGASTSDPAKEGPSPTSDRLVNGNEESGGGPSISAVLNTTSIATIATRARCQQAQSFLHYVKRVREEKKEDAATAAATAGHGWDWVEDNCRCGQQLGTKGRIDQLPACRRRFCGTSIGY